MKMFKIQKQSLPLPIFFPDATRAVVKTLDSRDLEETRTPGILVNTYHLLKELGGEVLERYGGIAKFMNWDGAIISDSGGFQVMSIVKSSGGKVTDLGVSFQESKKKRTLLTPEKSIQFQAKLATDLMVVLDDFTPSGATKKTAKETVERTILWAKRSKEEFEKIYKRRKKRPYLIAVIQGGEYQDLRKYCAEELVKIGFDGYGYGGWPIRKDGKFDYKSAQTIVDNTPDGTLLYGLGIGKPEEIVNLHKIGFQIFDCVLPTRDARHARLYVYNPDPKGKVNLSKKDFYSFFSPNKKKYLPDTAPVSKVCDCLLCKNYSKGYLAHLFKINDVAALRLATIHNLRFYSMLMEMLQ